MASGAAAALSAQLLVYALGFVSSVLVTRALGAHGRGVYSVAITAATVCAAVFNLGLDSATSILYAERRYTLPELARNLSSTALAAAPVAVAAMVVLYAAAGSEAFPSLGRTEFLIAVATVPFALHLQWMANAFLLAHRLRRSQLALACGALVQASGVAILYAAGALGVREALLAYAGFIAVPWALHLLWARGTLPVRPSRDWALGRRVVALGLKFYVGLTFSFLLLRFDIVLVNLYLQPADVGIYSIAVLFAELAWLITNPLVQAAVPFQASVPMRESAPLAFKTARFNMALALVLALAFAATMWFVLPFLYGTRFRDAYIPLVVLLPGIVAMAASRPLGLLVGRQLRPLLYSAATLGALSVNCALNVLLLPRIGIVGASVASAVSYALLAATFIAWSLKASSLTARQALVPGRDDFDTVRRALGRLRALGAGHRA